MNEARNLPATLANILLARDVEVIVVDGGSKDDTVQIAESFGVKVLSAAANRAVQMNLGAKAATGDILLFLHADTRLPAQFDIMIAKALFAGSKSNPLIKVPVAGAFKLRIYSSLLSLRLIEFGINWRSRWLQMPYGDQAIFLKPQLFYALGGFPDIPIMEDFEFMLHLRQLGRIVIIPVPVLTSARRWQKLGVFKTTLINQVAIIAYFLRIPPKQIAQWYRQH